MRLRRLTGWPKRIKRQMGNGARVPLRSNRDHFQPGLASSGSKPEWMGNAPEFEKCQWTKQNITVEPGDSEKSYIYTIDQAKLPASAGLICKKIPFMNDENGMNIGGLSALFNRLLIDFENEKVGFKPS
jgi:hypothetical protein